MPTQLTVGDVVIEVTKKNIKNVHLSVNPPEGSVRISAPRRMSLETIRTYAISRLAWIRRQQSKFHEQERETPREYLDRESHYVWGSRYLLRLVEQDDPPSVAIEHGRLVLSVRPRSDAAAREAVVAQWYREQIKSRAARLVSEWEPILGVEVDQVFVRQMKTKWGSCNPSRCTIRLNTELAKKPAECLDYVVVHEMVHLIEPTHGPRFVALMNRVMPQWDARKQKLNRLPILHADWDY